VNELIQKLAEAAGLDARTMGFENNHTAQWNARVTKLAELIVRECAEVVKWTPSMFPNNTIIKNIKEHFGVEE
jgi:hypothetical protein